MNVVMSLTENGDEFRGPATGLGGGGYLCSSPPKDRLREIVTAYTGQHPCDSLCSMCCSTSYMCMI